MKGISVNREALKVLQELLEEPEVHRVGVEKLPSGATIVDTGLEATGGLLSGLRITEIAMGGLGKASVSFVDYGGLTLPSVVVATDHPAIALLGCQLAGWGINVGSFSAMASGPGRALALKPKSVFKKIGYQDESDSAVLLLETTTKPDDDAAHVIAKKCAISPENLFLIITTTTSIAGSVQVSGRIVEVGMYRLDHLGFDPLSVISGVGYAPIMPTHPDSGRTLGREEDALIYGGATSYVVDFEDDSRLRELVEEAPSTTSKFYGKPSYDTLKSVDFDWSKLDPAFFAPGAITVYNRRSGATFSSGRIDAEMLLRSMS